ncbi:MAG: hypothetical protein NE330_21915 [Lentisphaeraceae bacterium]|nr:hypothetical protein [Lentisphaeraceae bacterium]
MKALQILAFVITIFLFIDMPQEKTELPDVTTESNQQKTEVKPETSKVELKHEEVAKLLFKEIPAEENLEKARVIAMTESRLQNKKPLVRNFWGFNSKTQVLPFFEAYENRDETTEFFYGVNVSVSF